MPRRYSPGPSVVGIPGHPPSWLTLWETFLSNQWFSSRSEVKLKPFENLLSFLLSTTVRLC